MQSDSVYKFCREQFRQKYQLTWLKPLGFNNSYCLMMRREQAQKAGIQSISDLVTYLGKN